MNKIGDRETLIKVANDWGDFPITDINDASEFLERLFDETNGNVIIDLLDTANWDCFESYSVDSDSGILQLNWHDFIEQDKHDTLSQEREMWAIGGFTESLYSLAMRFNRIDRVGNENIACFALRGYALTDKEIKKAFSSGTEDLLIRKNRPFSKDVIRKIDGHIEVIDCMTAAISTVLIVPKKSRIPASASKAILYQHNLSEIDQKLKRCEEQLDAISESDVDGICEKANTSRRCMETLLKLECCFREIESKKPYSKAVIGDLWNLLKGYHSESIQSLFSRFIQWANTFSHDTGLPIEKSKAIAIISMARLYVKLFEQEIERDHRHPRWRTPDEEYIAF